MIRLGAKPMLLASIALAVTPVAALAQNTVENDMANMTMDNESTVNTTTIDPMLNDPLAEPGMAVDPLATDTMPMTTDMMDNGMADNDDDGFPWGLLGLLGLAGLLGMKRRDDDVRVDRVDTPRDVPPAM